MPSKRFKKLMEKNSESVADVIEKLLPEIKKNCTVKFDESVDLSLQVNNKQKKGEVNIRTVVKGDHKHCLLHRNTKDDRAKKQNIKTSRQDCTPFLLETLVKYSDNVRLLLLSATPMYNSFKEIIWLLNLMNIND